MDATRSTATARDIMTPEPICVDPTTSLRELASLLTLHEVSGMPVVDATGAVVGVVSLTDVVRKLVGDSDERSPGAMLDTLSDPDDDSLAGILDPEELPRVQDIMTEDPVTVTPDVPVEAVAHVMREHRIHRVIVVDDDGGAAGIVTSLDTLAALTGRD